MQVPNLRSAKAAFPSVGVCEIPHVARSRKCAALLPPSPACDAVALDNVSGDTIAIDTMSIDPIAIGTINVDTIDVDMSDGWRIGEWLLS